MTTATAAAQTAPVPAEATQRRDVAAPLATDDTIGVLLDHPSLEGFAQYTLPWYGRDYDRDLALDRIGSLLPYHSAVDPDAVVAGLNRLIENAGRGVPVFRPIYSPAEQRVDPALAAAGRAVRRHRAGWRVRLCRLGA